MYLDLEHTQFVKIKIDFLQNTVFMYLTIIHKKISLLEYMYYDLLIRPGKQNILNFKF